VVKVLKDIWEEFLGRFLDFVVSSLLGLKEKDNSERRLRSYYSIYSKELEAIDKS
jgi:hypothetical protein